MTGITFGGTYTSTVTLNDPATQLPATIAPTGRIATTDATGVSGVVGTAWTVTNKGTITISGTAGFGIALGGGGLVNNGVSGRIDGQFQGVYVTNAPLTLTNAGTITSVHSAGIEARAGGQITNQAGALLSAFSAGAQLEGGGTVTNAGKITAFGSTAAGISLRGGGSATNAATGTIAAGFALYAYGAPVDVVNRGLMQGFTEPAIVLHEGGNVTNAAGGLVSGHYSAIHAVTASATVRNSGTLVSDGNAVVLEAGGDVRIGATGVVLAPSGFGIFMGGVGGSVTNAGQISASNTGIALFDGGSFTNLASGTVHGYAAVSAGLSPAVIVNNGLLVGGTGNFGVRLNAGGSVTNTGTITAAGGGIGIYNGAGLVIAGGTIASTGAKPAVHLPAGYTNRLVLKPAAVISGLVDGGNRTATVARSTLELAKGTGTLAGWGTQFVGFTDIQLDSGATWQLPGPVTLRAGTRVEGPGTLALSGAAVSAGTIYAAVQLFSGTSLLNLAAGSISGAGIRVASGPATIINAGTIAAPGGGPAIRFADADGNRLILQPGGVLSGQAIGGAASDTLELAAGTGTLTSIGARYLGFETLQADAGANWRLAGPNTLATNPTVALSAGTTLAVAGTVQAAGTVALTRLGRLQVLGTGAVTVGTAPATKGAITVAANGAISGIGALGGTIIDSGTITAHGGALRLLGNLSGPGTIAIDTNSILAIYGAAGVSRAAFLPGGHETLLLGSPAATTATIAGFAATDTIDLKGIGTATSTDFNGTTLTIHAAATVTLDFTDPTLAGHFAIATDNHGGTNVTFV